MPAPSPSPRVGGLGRDFFRQPPVALAKALLGLRLVRVHEGQRLAGTIVETEAYLGAADLAAHTVGGRRTLRNASMWLDGGTAYVYFTYGMHHCFNVVASLPEDPVAVLIRALEPVEGLDTMAAHRGRSAPRELCSGPAKLCQALAIDRALDGEDLATSQSLFIEPAAPGRPAAIAQGPRVGVAYAGEWAKKPLRFWLKNHPFVSRAR